MKKYIDGSTSDGAFDAWLSTPGNDDKHEHFEANYVQEILSSVAGNTFAKFSVPSKEQILEIRESAKTTCNGKNLPSAKQPITE